MEPVQRFCFKINHVDQELLCFIHSIYCGVIFICVGQCPQIIKNFAIFWGNVISWVNVLLRCNVRRFTTLLYVLGDLELVDKGNPQKSNTNNDDSTVHSLLITKVKICNHMLYRHVTILKHLSLFSFSQVLRVSHRCKEGRPSRSGIYSAHVCGSESGPRQDYLFSFHLCTR